MPYWMPSAISPSRFFTISWRTDCNSSRRSSDNPARYCSTFSLADRFFIGTSEEVRGDRRRPREDGAQARLRFCVGNELARPREFFGAYEARIQGGQRAHAQRCSARRRTARRRAASTTFTHVADASHAPLEL